MSNTNPSDVAGFSLLIMVLIVISLFSAGCLQNSRLPAQSAPTLVPETTRSLIITQTEITTIAQTGQNRIPVNITINSVIRTDMIHGSRSGDNDVFIVVDLTIDNNRAEPFNLQYSLIRLNGAMPIQKIMDHLETPIPEQSVQPGGILRGEAVFPVKAVTQKLVLVVKDTDGRVLFSKELNEGSLMGYDTSKSDKLRALMQNNNFTDVIRQLDTPLLAAQYTNEKFKFSDDGSCLGYTPQEFFIAKRGDCSDFSGFFAYALAAHGYDAKKISFKYYNNEGNFRGHVVGVFTEKDGQLRYATIPDLTQFRNISSLDDLISQEKIRLEFKEIIGGYKIHDPETTDVCHFKSLSEIPTQNMNKQ